MLLEVAFAQHATGTRRESGKEEVLGERQARVGRGAEVAAFHPVFGAQVFEVDPDRPELRAAMASR